MGKGKDISGQRFGRLVAIEPLRSEKGRGVIWRCKCDCGGEIEVCASRLINGKNKSCGCLNKEIKERADITGQRFGRLVAIRPDHVDEKRRTCWLFRCDCGNEKIMPAAAVKFHRVRSCGCLYLEHASNLNKQDIEGQRFDRLTAIRPTENRDASGSIIWECLCDCGNIILQSVNVLNGGRVHSCGCWYRETRPDAYLNRRDLIEDTSLSTLAAAKVPHSASGHVGVYQDKRSGSWYARIQFQKKTYYLGSYRDINQAISARKRAERELHDPIIMENWESMTPAAQRKFLENLDYQLPVELIAHDHKAEDPKA